MLRYDTPPNLPIRRLLSLVLLMALRDKADQIRFRLSPDYLGLRYRVDGAWYDLVPPPKSLWPQLIAEVRRVGRLVPPEPVTGWRTVLGGWFAKPEDPAAGWLTFRVRDRDQLFAARLDPDPVQGEIVFEPVGPTAVDPESATAALGELMRHQGGDLYVEFEVPPDVGK